MGPQCEDGFTKIANELLEALCRIRVPGESMQVFLTILRKTYGFGKKEDRISLSQFAATGIGKTHVSRAVKLLVDMGMISVTKKGNDIIPTYQIIKHYSQWKPLPKKVTLPKKVIEVTEKGNGALPKMGTTKEKVTKETSTKETKLLIICAAWKSYVQMRVKIKKPMTNDAMILAVSKLQKLQSSGSDPVAVLEQSVFYSWQGLFPLKEDRNGSGRPGNPSGTGSTPQKKGGIIQPNGPEADWLGGT